MRLPQLLLGTLALALAAVASAATINLGASVQLSGPLANTGLYYQDVYTFALSHPPPCVPPFSPPPSPPRRGHRESGWWRRPLSCSASSPWC